MSGASSVQPDPVDPRERAELAWALRYARPQVIADVVAHDPPTPYRHVLEAFLAWRGAHLGAALETVLPVVDAGDLPPRWSARARNVVSVVLQELGRAEDALASQLLEMEDAHAAGDVVAQLTVVHDLAVTYELTDPPRAIAQLHEAWTAAEALLDVPDPEGIQIRMIAALALANLHFQTAELDALGGPRPGEDAAEGVPGIDVAIDLADTAWPELAAALRAAQALVLLDAGDVEAARARVDRLPDPAAMRDVTNAAMVVRARAALARHDGDLGTALDLLVAVDARMSDRFRSDVLADIADLYEQRGQLAEALATARRQVEMTRAFHLDESRTAVRALEVHMRTGTAQRAADAARRTTDELRHRVEELRRARDELAAQVLRDPLTGLGNRARLDAARERLGAGGGHEVALVDVDRFKLVNDRAGHAAGDEALRAVARVLVAAAGPQDVVVRLGGDEIVVVRPACAGGGLAADLRAACHVEASRGLRDAGVDAVTLSIAVARVTGGWDEAFERADAAMYEAKRAGGARVVEAPAP